MAELYFNGRVENALLHDQLRLIELESQSINNQLEAERIVSSQELADALRQAGAPPEQKPGTPSNSAAK
jgi:hypothetical protein